MNYPKELLIGGVPYEVKVVKGFIKEDPNGNFCTGEINYANQEILLTDQMKFEYGSKVLLHEAIHGMLHEYGMDKYNKEDLVCRLTPALLSFVKNNDLGFLAAKQSEPVKIELAEKKSQEFVEQAVKALSSLNKEPQPKRSRSVDLIDGASSTFTLADIAKVKSVDKKSPEEEADKQDQPDFWTTGIKIKDGVEHYKTYYECACGMKSRRYLSLEEDACECHECSVKIQKEPAVANKPMQRDSFGNYFVAKGIKKY